MDDESQIEQFSHQIEMQKSLLLADAQLKRRKNLVK